MKMVPLGNIAPAIPSDRAFAPSDEVWQLTLDQIEPDTGRITNRVLAPASTAKASTLCFDESHLLYSKLRPYLNKVVCPDRPGLATTELVPLRPDPNVVDRRYLWYYLRSPEFVHWATNQVAGAKMPRLRMKALWEHDIPLPPLPEQKRIAAILDKADAIRCKRAQALELADEFLKSAFLDMFGDPVTNPKGWDEGTLDDIVQDSREGVRCGPFGTQLKVHELVDDGIPLLGIENVQNDSFVPSYSKFLTQDKAEELHRFEVHADDVLITRMGTIGRACVVPNNIGDVRISYHLFRVRPDPDKCIPQFLAATICKSGTFQRQLTQLSHGAIMSGLNTSILREIKFLIPPVSQQKAYVQLVRKQERMSARLNQQAEAQKTLLASLTQHAFCGKL